MRIYLPKSVDIDRVWGRRPLFNPANLPSYVPKVVMATRRLTDAFLLMRNNAIQNRQILAEQVSTYEPRRTLNTRSNAAVSLMLIV